MDKLFVFFSDGTATHFLQTETKKEYDSWLIALRQTAYSRIGGGELFAFF